MVNCGYCGNRTICKAYDEIMAFSEGLDKWSSGAFSDGSSRSITIGMPDINCCYYVPRKEEIMDVTDINCSHRIISDDM
jgi:hypothetical protein